jgi:hypothetical protein
VTGQAFIEIVDTYGWETILLLYQDVDSMSWLKPIFDRTSQVPANKYSQV